jgi:cysteine synthase
MNHVIDAIGHTPLIRLRFDSTRTDVRAKLELQNLYGMKDRVAKQAVLHARATGELAPGAPIVESSSGTMALGLALVGAALGHPVHIVTDPRIDPITLAKLRALDVSVHVVPEMTGAGWQSARLERLEELRHDLPGAYWPRQYSNPQNPAAYRTLAQELLEQMGRIDVLVGAVGSGGSLSGTARALRESLPDLHTVGIDAVGSALFDQPDRPKRLQGGLGNSLIPQNLDYGQIDEVHWLSDREAFASTRRLAAEQAVFGGNTSGSVYRILGYLSRREAEDTRIVGIFPDRGDRYHASVYCPDYWREHGLDGAPEREAPAFVEYGTVVESWSYALLPKREFAPKETDLVQAAAVR